MSALVSSTTLTLAVEEALVEGSSPGEILEAVLFDLTAVGSAAAATGSAAAVGDPVTTPGAAAVAGVEMGHSTRDGADDADAAAGAVLEGAGSERSCSARLLDAEDLRCSAACTLALAARSCIISDSILVLHSLLWLIARFSPF